MPSPLRKSKPQTTSRLANRKPPACGGFVGNPERAKIATVKPELSSPFDFLIYSKKEPQRLQNDVNCLWVIVADVDLMRLQHPKNSS
ncbi:hypothetical protein V6N13_024908 [Hibiscus sabdariffa]|uniref:Uncharacterized protein n=1 Tax=Hibiscus sabdariffa TaxID=183260 RepID=A0ABR1ZXN0_9ROSI